MISCHKPSEAPTFLQQVLLPKHTITKIFYYKLSS